MKSAVQMVFGGPYSAGASRHRRPFLIAKMMPLIIRLSSIRRICVADSQIKALMAAPLRGAIEYSGTIVVRSLRTVHMALR